MAGFAPEFRAEQRKMTKLVSEKWGSGDSVDVQIYNRNFMIKK